MSQYAQGDSVTPELAAELVDGMLAQGYRFQRHCENPDPVLHEPHITGPLTYCPGVAPKCDFGLIAGSTIGTGESISRHTFPSASATREQGSSG